MNKVILEKYIDREVKLTMPENIFILMTQAFEQTRGIGAHSTFVYIYEQLPEELKLQVNITVYTPNKNRIHMGVDFESIVLDEYEVN